MKFVAMIAAAFIVQQTVAPSAFDQPIGALRVEKSDDTLDRMSLNQIIRMSALPPVRMREFQCAGVANWSGSKAWPAFVLTEDGRSAFVDQVAVAFAHDLKMEKAVAVDLIARFSEEPPYRKQKGELSAWRAEMERNCADLIAKVRNGTYQIAPLAQPWLVDSTLANCYARYLIAAETAKDERESKELRATASRAAILALAGKQGDALTKARAALDQQFAEARADKLTADGDDMMRLVMCLPAMEAAAREQAK